MYTRKGVSKYAIRLFLLQKILFVSILSEKMSCNKLNFPSVIKTINLVQALEVKLLTSIIDINSFINYIH